MSVLAVGAGAADKADPELEKLAGKYSVVSIESDGKPLPPEALKDAQKMQFVIKGNTLSIAQENEKPRDQTITIDATKNPKQIDITREDVVEGPKGKAPAKPTKKTSPGIYQFDGKTLKICADDTGKTRPTSFDTAGHESFTMVVLKKE
jgi:uncharacterized protein (TIGR03067 family)